MKIKRFTVEMYQWDVALIEASSRRDYPKVRAELIKFGCEKEEIKVIKHNLSCRDGGDHLFDLGKKKSMILLYRMSSKSIRTAILCHEKRHLEDRILECCHVDDIEASAYLAGYLGGKLL